jgi:hypothetical protein
MRRWPATASVTQVDPRDRDRDRPASLEPQQLGFTPQPQVPWLSPLLLLRTGIRTALAMIFGAYLDKRELQGALPERWYNQPGVDGELWLDYVADLGDGFNATYSVAHLLAQPRLTVDGHDLPRGQVLLMGGDLVYPSASMRKYANRTKGPYTAAMPLPPADGSGQPTLYALPANHDWYDGLTAFLRMFVGQRAHHVGGWRLEQTRSYVAVELPHRWWLFAIDEAFGAYIDDPQLVYFEQAAARLGPDDRVIIAAPAPTWAKADPCGYESLDYFIRTVIAPTGARVPLMLAGDQHYYARYSHPQRQLVTCGGGGAYLSATHTIPEQITVPPRQSIVRQASPREDYQLAARYPSAGRSRRLSWGVFGRLPWRNPGFVTMLGTLHTLLMLAIAGAAPQLTTVEERLVTIPLAVMVLLVVGAALGFAYIPTGGPKTARHFGAGLLHGAAHVGLGIAGAALWLALPLHTLAWPLPLLAAAALYLPVAGLAASLLFATYLLIGSRFRINVNELFAAQGIEGHKSFLRLRFAADGSLTIYPVGVDRVCRRWRADPEAERPDASWIVPAKPDTLRYRLAEDPITIR